MQRVAGIGGVFFRAKNPTATAQWYKEYLGIDLVPADYSQKPWVQEAGPTVFAPFPQDSEYFGDARKHWMINFSFHFNGPTIVNGSVPDLLALEIGGGVPSLTLNVAGRSLHTQKKGRH
jgi:hypothetical protein